MKLFSSVDEFCAKWLIANTITRYIAAMSENNIGRNVTIKDEIYQISLVLANLGGVSVTDFIERAVTREVLTSLEMHNSESIRRI